MYRYDHHNRLSEVWDSSETNRKAAFTCDALGRRIVYEDGVLDETGLLFQQKYVTVPIESAGICKHRIHRSISQ